MANEMAAIVAAHRLSKVDVQFFWYDNQILFYPARSELLSRLEFTEKERKCDKSTRFVAKMVYSKQKAYTVVQSHGEKIAVTFQGFINKLLAECAVTGMTFDVKDLRISCTASGAFPEPRLDLMHGFRYSQEELLTSMLVQDRSGLLEAPTRFGKCLGKDSVLITYDYQLKKVQDVVVGDMLMGPDGKPRKVVALGRGREQSYRIIPNKGEAFTCNESHILSFKITGGAKFGGWHKGDIVNMTVKDYLTRSKSFKHVAKLWWAPLEFEEKPLPVDPWIVGVWIGDGCVSGCATLTKPDLDVQNGIKDWAIENGYIFTLTKSNVEGDAVRVNIPHDMLPAGTKVKKTSSGGSAFRVIKNMCVRECEKRIPTEYLTSSREQRLELLAGLIDTDGYSNNGLGYEIVTKYAGLSEDIVRLCRGLGFRVTRIKTIKTIKSINFSGEYWRLQISGKLEDIPCRGHKKIYATKGRVDPMMSGFTVEDIGEQDYYGFELDGPDSLFLLWDHLVTHNTSLMVNTMRAFPKCMTVLTAPGVDLIQQLYEDVTGERGIPDREVRMIGGGKNQKPTMTGINVVSMDSLHKLPAHAVRLLLCDEPHAAPATSRLRQIDQFPVARRYGFGATLSGRSDGKDLLIEGLFGPVLARRTYLEAVAEGAICPLHIIFLEVEITPQGFRDRDAAYDSLLFGSTDVALLVADICNTIIPKEQQTLIFIKHEKQADLFLDKIGRDTSLAMAKKMSSSERQELTSMLRDNVVTRCLCTRIFVQGVTFPDVRVLINAEAGGNTTSAIQKPGRLAQNRPGKKCGIVIDLNFVPQAGFSLSDYRGEAWTAPINDSKARRKAYQGKGYTIHDVKNLKELKEKFNELQ